MEVTGLRQVVIFTIYTLEPCRNMLTSQAVPLLTNERAKTINKQEEKRPCSNLNQLPVKPEVLKRSGPPRILSEAGRSRSVAVRLYQARPT